MTRPLVLAGHLPLISADEYRECVRPWEPCFELAEVNLVTTAPGAGLRRVQVVRVIRDDHPVEFRRDMGPAGDYSTEEFAIPGAVEVSIGRYDVLETVERMMAVADGFRAVQDKPFERPVPPIDFIAAFEQVATRRRDARVGRKHFAI